MEIRTPHEALFNHKASVFDIEISKKSAYQHKTLATSLNSSESKYVEEEHFHYVDFSLISVEFFGSQTLK